MRLTAEIRWFWAARPLPLFRSGSPARGRTGRRWLTARRAPMSICATTPTALGIKKRGGQAGVEIKGLIAPGKTILEHAGCSAPVELWAKWPSRTLKIDGAALIRVQKRRWMRKFRVSAGHVVECTGSDRTRKSGCDAELTLIEVEGAAWWTFGFEAFGELERVEDDLAATVAVLAGRNPPAAPWRSQLVPALACLAPAMQAL